MANRISNAFQALLGNLPEPRVVTKYEDREVVGPSMAVTLYQYVVKDVPDDHVNLLYFGFHPSSYRYAHTCEQAHEAAGGREVKQVKALKVGRSYFLLDSAASIKVLPKPRAAK